MGLFLGPRLHRPICCPLAERRPGSEPIFGAIAGATVSAFFSFGGWWEAGKIAGEVRNPRRNLPLAFTGGVLLVTAVYLLLSFAFVSVVPFKRIASNTAFVVQFGQALFGSLGGKNVYARVRAAIGIGRPDGAYHGRSPGVLCHGERRRVFLGLRPLAPSLRNTRQRRSAANRAGAARYTASEPSIAFSPLSSSRRCVFLRSLRLPSFACRSAVRALVVSGGAGSVSARNLQRSI